MKKSDAEKMIKQELKIFSNGQNVEKLDFYSWIQNNKPELLNFRSAASKYQLIASWVDQFNSQL